MKSEAVKIKRGVRARVMVIFFGACLNATLYFLTMHLGLPIYLDTIGTMCAAWLGGIFPGVMAAFFTNLICESYSGGMVYYSFINVLIALYIVHFHNRHAHAEVSEMAGFAVGMGFLSGSLGFLTEWGLYGYSPDISISVIADYIERTLKISPVISLFVVHILLDIFDKGISVSVAFFIISHISNDIKRYIREGVWRQRPLSIEELVELRDWSKDVKVSSRRRMSVMLVGLCCLLVFITGFIGIRLYYTSEKEARTENARKAVQFAAEIIDIDRIDEYLRNGRAARGYNETETLLQNICNSAYGVEKLRVVKTMKDGVYFIFDLGKNEDYRQFEPGTLAPKREEFEAYSEDFIRGNEIVPIESRDNSGTFLNIYYPLKKENTNTGVYIGAEISLTTVWLFLRKFLYRLSLILAGFFLLLIVVVSWMVDIYVEYPISSLARCVDRFASSGYDQLTLDENVKTVRKLGIRTGDEVEKLYHAICQLTLNQAEQMRNIRKLSESTARMQDGIIVTMADMVENRDSDTGAHIQKTAAYVKIIVEGLKKKGYYAEKISPKFMADTVRSAPLHDVGKINISDSVLNKPGKLTDEEYEIMKTHTTAGKKIMETAISSVHGESYLKEARNMAAYHHERWDGKGYPEGLHGDVIPLSARIMAVADVFDALTSPRVYKPAFPMEKAVEMLKEGAGSQFDPKCVEVFLEALPEVREVLEKYNGDI